MGQLTRDKIVDEHNNVVVDCEYIDYDAKKYDFQGWVKRKIAEKGYDSSDLTRLHEHIPYDQVAPLGKWLIQQTGGDDWRMIAHAFTREVLEPAFGKDIAVQRFMNIRILLPQRHEMIINFHTGLWYGHGMGAGTCWVPLTPVFDTNSMYTIGRQKSVELCQQAYDEKWRQDKMQEVFFQHAKPVVADVGQAFLFNQEVLHGNVPNQTGQTRVSIDFRLTVRGGKIRRKLVGGYFILLNEDLIKRHQMQDRAAA